jgi:hypothetical protein
MAVFNVAAFRPLLDFKKEVADFARYLKSTPPSEGSRGVFYPGEVEHLRELERRKNGHRDRGCDLGEAQGPRRRLQARRRTQPALTNPDTGERHDTANGAGWLLAGAELYQPAGLLAHPESRDDSMSADYYQEIARILERGKFHMAFFDDRLAMPDRYNNDHAHTVEYGIRCVKMDPIVVLTTMGMVTTKLGLASTASTTYFEPFDVARRFATLDLMTGGRAAWNVVTSVNDGEALNMGKAQHLDHDPRYDRADEFMEVVLGHWDSWEDGSLVIDKKSGRFGRSDQGEAARSQGRVLQLARSVHGTALTAGASGDRASRRLRPRTALCRPLGRSDLHRGAQSRALPSRITTPSAVKPPRPGAIPTRCSCAI